MALSRKARTWIIILSIPVILVIGVALALKILFSGDRLKAFIVPKIEAATHRAVSINTMSLSVFPTLAIDVEGLTVSNAQGEGFTDKPMVQLDRLVLDVRLLALLKGNIEVSEMTLDHPRLFLEVNGAGRANYAEKEPPGPPATGTRGGESPGNPANPPTTVTVEVKSGGYGLLVSNFQVVDGILEYVDRKGGSATTLEGVNLKVRADAPSGASEITVDIHTTIDGFSYGSLTAPLVSNLKFRSDLSAVYDVKGDVVRIRTGTFTVQEIPLSMSGEVTACTKTPLMNLVVTSDKVSIPELLSLIPQEYMRKAEGVKGTGVARARIEIRGSATDSTNPDVTGMISATGASIQYPQLPKAITGVNVVADFTRGKKKQEFRLTKFSALLGSNPLDATMTVVNFDDPSLTLAVNASMNLADVRDYYPLEAGTDLSGALKANVHIAGKVSAPAAMKAAGSAEFQSVTIKTATNKNPVRNLNGTVVFNNQVVEAKKLTMDLGQSDLSLAFSVRNYLLMMSTGQAMDKKAPRATASVTLKSNHLYTADVMGDAKSAGGATTSQPQAAVSRPQGAGTGREGNGKPSPAAKAESRKAGVLLPNVDMDIVASIGTLTMEKFELKNVHGTIRISDGIIDLQNLACNAFDGSVATKGTLNMQKPDRPAFDLTFDMKNVDAHALLPKFTSFGDRMFGRLSMNTTMKGMLNDTLGLVPQGLNGQGKVNVQDGKLTGVKVNQTIASLVNLPDLEEITFKDWENAFTIADGRVVIKDLRIKALGADYTVNGSQGFDGSLDYGMTMLLSDQTSTKVAVPGFAGEAVKLFKEPGGRVRLDFAVTGTNDNPKVSLDTRAARKKAEDLAKQKVNEEAKKLGDEAKKKAGNVLKDLFKKKK